MSCRHHVDKDENTGVNTGETIGHAMGPWAKESPKKPTMGKAGEREPAKALEHAQPAINTNEEFFAKMAALMNTYMGGISETIERSINTSTIRSQESTMLIRDEIRSMLKDLKDEVTTSREELSKGLRDLGQQISREITVAMMASAEHTNNLNQASLQTIIDILQNRDNVQAGANPEQSYSYT